MLWRSYGGIELWRGTERGLRLSRIVQALQVPIIQSGSLAYNVYLAVRVGVFLTSGELRAVQEIGTTVHFAIGTSAAASGHETLVGINLVALLLWWLLRREIASSLTARAMAAQGAALAGGPDHSR